MSHDDTEPPGRYTTIRVDVLVYDRLKKLQESLEPKLGRGPTLSQLITHLLNEYEGRPDVAPPGGET